ncbi:MAG: hypothetical protein ACETWQ_02850 [Phycisphaerae bacterium]
MCRVQFFIVIIIAVLFFVLALGNTYYSGAFLKKGSDSKDIWCIIFGFENAAPAVIVSRNGQTNGKLTGPTGLTKHAFTTSDCLSTKNLFVYIGNVESSHVAINGVNAHTLVSLHCLLKV